MAARTHYHTCLCHHDGGNGSGDSCIGRAGSIPEPGRPTMAPMPGKRRVFLVHWHKDECAERAERLIAMGYDVASESRQDGVGLRTMDSAAPDAVVIDLGRLPSHGREVALAVRQRQKSRHLPLVFVDGDAAKVEALRDLLPDATFTTWKALRPALAAAIANPPSAPVVPSANPAGYSGTPLPKKLGIQADHAVVVLGAPDDFVKTLGTLPRGATLLSRARAGADVIILFSRRAADLRRRIASLIENLADGGSLWLAWPKQSAVKERPDLADTDLNDNSVRAIGLDAGVVDTKVCAIDAVWSGLRFQRRRKGKGKGSQRG